MNLQVPLVYVFSGGFFYSKGSDKRTQTNNIFYTNGWSVMTFNFGRCRFLRNKDRQLNKDKYPNLNHPEVYLLHGGYKAFYQNYKVILLHLLPILLFHHYSLNTYFRGFRCWVDSQNLMFIEVKYLIKIVLREPLTTKIIYTYPWNCHFY